MCDNKLTSCVIPELLCFFLVFAREQFLKNLTNLHRTFHDIIAEIMLPVAPAPGGPSNKKNYFIPISAIYSYRTVYHMRLYGT